MITKLLNISERVNLAFHALGYVAAAGGENTSVKRISAALDVSETYLSKILQLLVHNGYLISKRGVGGGHILAKKPQEITAYDIFTLMEGPLPDNTCLFGHQHCGKERCVFHEVNTEIQTTMERSFRKITVDQLMKNYEHRVG